MAVYLTIDTSAGVSVGVVSGELGNMRVLAREHADDTRAHVEQLTPLVRRALASAGVTQTDMVIAGNGPAAFTGLRAGLVTARALARAWNVPVHGVSSLRVLARAGLDALLGEPANEQLQAAQTRAPEQKKLTVVAIDDARRKEVYALRAQAHATDPYALEIVQSERVLAPAALAQELSEQPAVVVKQEADAQLYPEHFPEALTVPVSPIVPVQMVLAGLTHAETLGGGDAYPLEPLYLRRPDVHAGGVPQPPAQGNPYAGH